MNNSSRNSPCACGSGRRYKHCCGINKSETQANWQDSSQGDQTDELAQALKLHQAGKVNEAEKRYTSILVSQPENPTVLHYLGVCKYQQGNFTESIEFILAALAHDCQLPLAQNNLGLALKELKRYDEAMNAYENAIEQAPNNAIAYNNRGLVLQELGQSEQARTDYEKAICLNPNFAEAYNNLGKVFIELGHFPDALESFTRAISVRPELIESYINRGKVFSKLNQHREAIDDFDYVVAHGLDATELGIERCNSLNELRRYSEALACYDRVIENKPNLVDAYVNRGGVLNALNRYEEAIDSLAKAMDIKPDLPYVETDWLFNKLRCCDWGGIDEAFKMVLGVIERGVPAKPMVLLAVPATPAQQKICAETYIEHRFPADLSTPCCRGGIRHNRIRIGYLSSDFCDHPVAHLVSHLIECHDPSRFETIGISTGSSKDNPWRNRLIKGFDKFCDVGSRQGPDIAAMIRDMGVDILINLNGHTKGARTDVFALRPAPIQVNYLGYVGTMGANYMDYIIADEIVIPEQDKSYYTEKIVYLPDCYQVNDSTKIISSRRFTRKELDLPQDAFVFCCFNNTYKITPNIFNIWMRLLRAVEGSVLWLYQQSPASVVNLRQEASNRGIAPERLIFANRMPLADYLARYQAADLFLDTPHYNAGTTASDALWAGLPVLTCLGSTFSGRMAASLLHAVGLEELITHDHCSYETLALELATRPNYLAEIRKKLAVNRQLYPLFNTERFTRNIEKAFIVMYERLCSGQGPDHINISSCL